MRALAFVVFGAAVVVSSCAGATPRSLEPPPPHTAVETDPGAKRPPADHARRCAESGAHVRSDASKPHVMTDASGAEMTLVPVETYFVAAMAWSGDDLLLARRYNEIGVHGQYVQNAIEAFRPPQSAAHARHLLGTDTSVLVPIADGSRFVLASRNVITVHDRSNGNVESRFDVPGERVARLVTTGTGAGLAFLVASDRVGLYDAHGTVLGTFTLDGTTPTITRVYRGPGVHHDNILRDSPTWAEALAITDDKRWVAVGGSDSKIRLFDRTKKKTSVLEHKWTYTEHRPMGGNADLNRPLAMRFTKDGKQLVVAYAHGEILTWDVATGARAQTVDGACTQEEADAVVNRFHGPNDPATTATAAQRQNCGPAQSATFSPNMDWIALKGELVRVRSLPTGKPLAMIKDVNVVGMMSVSRAGVLAMGDIYGRVLLWSPTTATKELLPTPISTGPNAPALSTNGRFLSWQLTLARSRVVWDLEKRVAPSTRLRSPDSVIAIASNGSRALVRTKDGVEVRARIDAPGTKLDLDLEELGLSASGRYLVALTGEGASTAFVVRDLEQGAGRGKDAQIRTRADRAILGADGTKVVTFGRDAKVALWETSTDQPIFEGDAGASAVALSANGRRLAWLVQTPQKPSAVARSWDATSGKTQELSLDGWVSDVTVSPDGAEVVILLQNGKIARWWPEAGRRQDLADDRYVGPNHVRFADDGRTVFLEEYEHVDIHRRDEAFTFLARFYALHSGGFLAVSADGAVEGSDEAPESTIVRATHAGNLTVSPGRASWSKWASKGVIECALAGEIVELPR